MVALALRNPVSKNKKSRFRSTYQMSPSEYLQRVRVHYASQALLDTGEKQRPST